MTSRRRNIVVGLTVLLGLGIVAWMVLLFAGRMASLFAAPGIPVTMKTKRADGVSEGSTIYFRGVPTGRVTKVYLDPGNQGVVLTADINRTPRLPANLHPVIRTQSAFGNAAEIDLEVDGAPSGNLAAGTTLVATYEGSALIPRQITELAEEVRRQQLLQHLDQAVLSILQQSERAGQLLQSFQQIVGDPHTKDDLRTAVANMRAATASAVRIGTNMEKFSDRMVQVGGKADTTLSDVRVAIVKLSDVLDHFDSVSTKIDQGKGTAGLLVNDPKLYQGLADSTRQLNLTIAALQRVIEQWEQEGVTIKLGK